MSFPCITCQSPVEEHFKSCPACGDAISEFLREYAQKPIGGNYQLLGRLGRGGMGEVYKARHIFLQNDCVIKVMRPSVTAEPELEERFIREARVARKIQHKNVASLYEFSGMPDGSYYMVSEFIDGKNAGQIIHERGALPPDYVTRLSIQALNGLQAIHEAGFVHRDISPDNIMVTTDEKGAELVKIIDLGIAKGEEAGDAMTKTGMFIGKLKYASPEQLGILPEGQRIDGRADIYSFGLVMYEMLAGKAAFQASTPHQYLIMQTREAPEPLKIDRAVTGGAELEALLLRAVAKDRDQRFSSAAEFSAALTSLQAGAAAGDGKDITAVQTVPTPLPAARFSNMSTTSTTSNTRTATTRETTDPYALLPVAAPAKRSRKWLLAIPAVLLVAALVAFAFKRGSAPTVSAPAAPVALGTAPPVTPPAAAPSNTFVESVSTVVQGQNAPPAAEAATETVQEAAAETPPATLPATQPRKEAATQRVAKKEVKGQKPDVDDGDKAESKVASEGDKPDIDVDKAIAAEKSIRGIVTSRFFKKNRDRILGRKP
ncbi:MAG TPA: serine/threonine-protein kinase [Thermoanaerobaculia bacterium]|nr:serine/threonine-protein kinase [Thermoanaerobaculia bacterium]